MDDNSALDFSDHRLTCSKYPETAVPAIVVILKQLSSACSLHVKQVHAMNDF